ncbi:MAG: zinc ABC transporter substrate-binding protein [Chloroflexi bacterium]|nr:zinc ABC transporter substrate-binding protein [Chloroflexota bacterium]MCI0579269.1 zinc ABC transporter substrate-binding protein [Chloroflexota bacterium]MCI0643472.1 zinc ABC transporter substrate-binding protein [Chloroflexota bacterium]MCI0728051.1 zinc ABC transporter substrate-binding protein [Chloroflexota bacterium]
MIRQIFGFSFLVILLLALTACGGAAEGGPAEGQLNVVATTGQIHDALVNIGGDAIHLTGLLGPGVDPHLYVPTESNVSTLSEADVIFYNGLHLEAQMVRIMTQMASRGVTVVAVGDALPPEQLLDWDSSAPYDPHIWNDPLLWSQAVEIMRDTLINADPENAELYRANTEKYLAEIAETHEYIQAQIAKIPPERRVMITAHDAFGYFARTYGLEVRGLQGISTESEASTADVQELANFIVERQVPAIFVETSVPPRTIEAVQAAVRAQGFEVSIGGSLFSDALGEQGHPAATYTGMLRYNAETLAAALGE